MRGDQLTQWIATGIFLLVHKVFAMCNWQQDAQKTLKTRNSRHKALVLTRMSSSMVERTLLLVCAAGGDSAAPARRAGPRAQPVPTALLPQQPGGGRAARHLAQPARAPAVRAQVLPGRHPPRLRPARRHVVHEQRARLRSQW